MKSSTTRKYRENEEKSCFIPAQTRSHTERKKKNTASYPLKPKAILPHCRINCIISITTRINKGKEEKTVSFGSTDRCIDLCPQDTRLTEVELCTCGLVNSKWYLTDG